MARKVVLMYHSVQSREQSAVLGGFPFPFERFCWQVESAQAAGWRFGRVSQLHQPVAQDTLYITSDDGTADWANLVLPWCEARGIPTHVGVITGPWLDEPIYPVTHVVQLLLKTRSVEALNTLAEQVRSVLSHDQLAYVHRIYSYEAEPYRRVIKGGFNLIFDPPQCQAMLGELSDNERELMAQRFASADTYRRYRMVEVGVHTVAHTAMGRDIDAYMRDEVDHCEAQLKQHGLTHSGCFTLPMAPRYGATATDMIAPLQQRGYHGMMHTQGDWDGESFIIPRTDAKKVESVLGLAAWPDEARAQEIQHAG